MIVSSRSVFIGSAFCALSLHVAGMAVTCKPEKVELAAPGAVAEVRQGNAFADLATGVISGVTTADPTATVQQPVEAVQTTAATTTPNVAVKVQPGATAVIATSTTTANTTVSPTHQAQTLLSVQPVVPAPTPTVTTSIPAAAAPATPTEAVTAEALDPSTVLTSLRPVRRPEGLAPPPALAETAPTPRGNATQNATAGATSNTAKQATATTSGSNAQDAVPVTATANSQAATNYPGQVMRRISRVRKPNTNVRGAVMVSFTIAAGGRLSEVAVAQSSGNAQLDQMAVQAVQRAAPFPAPPSGAQTRFNVEITGR